MTDELLAALDPAFVVPVVAVLVDKNSQENGSIFEIGGGRVAKYRWERSKGAVFKCDENFTAGAVLQKWSQVNDFTDAEHPTGPMDLYDISSRSQAAQPNPKTANLDFTGKVVLVTGGAAGYASDMKLDLEHVTNKIPTDLDEATLWLLLSWALQWRSMISRAQLPWLKK